MTLHTSELHMSTKIGRNQPCPCGSGLKYKRCCGRIAGAPAMKTPLPAGFKKIAERHRAQERIREAQQGLGRPVVAFKANDHQLVAVGNTVYWSKTWKTFPDFLSDYLKRKLDPQWGNAELAKPFADRHPIIQWYDSYCRYQAATIKVAGVPHSAQVTGIVACYLGLAYNLYLIDHNVELQSRLIRRLKNVANFQGAYYELIVANILIRAGFALTLEDETDGSSKHCEFAAVSKRTGKKYWVEAKMRSVSGLLGKTDKDGTSDPDPISRMIPHLNAALTKPATDERLIFIDLNTDGVLDASSKPHWHDRAIARLDQYEARELPAGVQAYLLVTNMPYHRMPDATLVTTGAPFGLGIPDFNKPGYMRLTEIYRRKQKHIDVFNICDALLKYPQFPTTFDGSLPSESLSGAAPRVMIGETYFFEGIGDGSLVATVTAATVNEQGREVIFGVTDQAGVSHLLREPMSEAQLADYKAHPDAYFGAIMPVSRQHTDRYSLFEWLMESHKTLAREVLLERLSTRPDFAALGEMTTDELLAEYCEGMVGAMESVGIKPTPPGKPAA